jgi:hypothetical protein
MIYMSFSALCKDSLIKFRIYNMQDSYKKYLHGISWFILSLISSAINDVISKYAGNELGSMEVTFL